MKTHLISFLLLLISFTAFGQVNFEKGYFINNDNLRIECLIKNYDWKNNPKEIEYKLNENDDIKKAGLASVKEFGFPGYSKFIRADVKLDMSSMELSDYSTESQPVWSQEQLFLKTLIEGKASLYYYEDRTLRRFFYSVGDSAMQQLIYKDYITKNGNYATNFGFRHQLSNDVICNNAVKNRVDKVDYDRISLFNYFKAYNECEGVSAVEYIAGKNIGNSLIMGKRETFILRVKPGLNYTSLSFSDYFYPDHYTDFGNKITLQFGIEAEYILPFNRNKWGILFEPTFQYFNSEIRNSYGAGEIHLKSIEFPFGIRHYFFLNNNLKLFLDGLFIPGFAPNFSSTVTIPLGGTSIGVKDINSTNSLAFGLGIAYKKLSIEARYYSNRELLHNYQNYITSYRRLSVIAGFRIL